MNEFPLIPPIEVLNSVPRLSASEAERLLACPLRIVFDHDPLLRRLHPYAASALVGNAAHVTIAALIKACARGVQHGGETTRDVTVRMFDAALAQECARRDARIAKRGELPGDSLEPPPALPFYAMTRARLARFARQRLGERWTWPLPQLDAGASRRVDEPGRRLAAIESELPLQSSDGLIRGIADLVDHSGENVIVEELKTGEATPERLRSWKHQLLIYAKLYRDQYGCYPALLRVHSLAAGTYEFPCVEEEAAAASEAARAALSDLNQRLAGGASPEDLARPSEAACSTCPHRAWCEPYWSAAAPEANGADTQGVIVNTSGWEADLCLPSGDRVRADFKALRVVPRTGTEIRICGARVEAGGKLVCHRGTSAWRIRK